MRYLVIALVLAIGAFLHVSYALAFSSRDAGVVVGILEQLAPARGEPVYYDEEAADDWYEFDQEEDGLIAAAGFSVSGWRSAYDSTLKGMVALMPQDEFDAITEEMRQRVDEIDGLNEAQRQELAGSFVAMVDRLTRLRREGAAYADAVRPYHERLKALTEL